MPIARACTSCLCLGPIARAYSSCLYLVCCLYPTSLWHFTPIALPHTPTPSHTSRPYLFCHQIVALPNPISQHYAWPNNISPCPSPSSLSPLPPSQALLRRLPRRRAFIPRQGTIYKQTVAVHFQNWLNLILSTLALMLSVNWLLLNMLFLTPPPPPPCAHTHHHQKV